MDGEGREGGDDKREVLRVWLKERGGEERMGGRREREGDGGEGRKKEREG